MRFHDDYHQLTDLLIEVAGKLLDERGEFPPFAGAVALEGELSLYDAEGEYEGADSDPEVIELALFDGLDRAAKGGECRAAALCTHVLYPDGERNQEAVLIKLAHRDESSLNVMLPVLRDGERVALGQPLLGQGTLDLFLTQSS